MNRLCWLIGLLSMAVSAGCTASYDNKEKYSAGKLAKQFGLALANKLK